MRQPHSSVDSVPSTTTAGQGDAFSCETRVARIVGRKGRIRSNGAEGEDDDGWLSADALGGTSRASSSRRWRVAAVAVVPAVSGASKKCLPRRSDFPQGRTVLLVFPVMLQGSYEKKSLNCAMVTLPYNERAINIAPRKTLVRDNGRIS